MAYCIEMIVEQVVPYNSTVLHDVLKDLDEGAKERDEILGMFILDNDCAKEEERMVQKIIEQLYIEKEEFECILNLLNI